MCDPVDSPIVSRVHAALCQHVGLWPTQTVIVSVSGGCDSVALLRVLLTLQPRFRLNLEVLHFNHALRAEADDEEAFVRALAADHELPIHVRRLPPGWQEKGGSGGIQARSREWRRAQSIKLAEDVDRRPSPNPLPHAETSMCFATLTANTVAEEVAEERAFSDLSQNSQAVVALGHHADDQVETMVLKALRGCHVSNFQGMSWRAGRFVRPFLGIRKYEIREYLTSLGQPWKEDASNLEPKYKRNRVRLELLPLLDEMTAGCLTTRLQAAEEQCKQLRDLLKHSRDVHLSSDARWLESGRRALSVDSLLKAPDMLRDELFHYLVRETTQSQVSLSQSTLRRVNAQLLRPSNEWTIELPNGLKMRRAGEAIRVSYDIDPVIVITEHVTGVEIQHPASWIIEVGHAPDVSSNAIPPDALHLDVRGRRALRLREWREGDLFHPVGTPSPRSLSHFLRDQGLALDARRSAPLVLSLIHI